MFDKIKNLLKSKQPEQTKTQEEKTSFIPKSKYDFVEQYVVVDPNNLLHIGYEAWYFCNKTPVAYDNNGQGGFVETIELPTEWAQSFLAGLKTRNEEVRNDPKQRLISVINLKDNHKIYLVPHLDEKRGSVLIRENDTDKKRKLDWVLYVTPEINRAIVEQMKIRSRGYEK